MMQGEYNDVKIKQSSLVFQFITLFEVCCFIHTHFYYGILNLQYLGRSFALFRKSKSLEVSKAI